MRDYLKTSLVFYDNIEKQHRHNDCCQDIEWDILKSPIDRFLPFQIQIDTYGWVGDVNSVTLYDDTDIAIANLIAGYGIYPQIYVVSNCSWADTYVWIIYIGEEPLTANLPQGLHYIKITDDAGHAWYSEIFRICDMTGVTFDIEICDEWFEWTFFTFETNGLNITQAASPGAATADSFDWCEYSGVGDIYDYNITIEELVAWGNFPTFRLETPAGGAASNQLVTAADGYYHGTFVVTTAGYLHLGMSTGGRSDFTAKIELTKRHIKTYSGMIGVEWYNNCDFDGIIYQEVDKWALKMCGYKNRLFFERPLELSSMETIKNVESRTGTDLTKNIVQKQYYKFSVIVPEFLYNVIHTISMYANLTNSIVILYLADGDFCIVEELNIIEEIFDSNCYAKLTIEFREAAKVWTNCCDNYALISESSCP